MLIPSLSYMILVINHGHLASGHIFPFKYTFALVFHSLTQKWDFG